jgi:hypothetical protein
MFTVQIRGQITDDGHLLVALPDGLPPGEVNVTLELPGEEANEWSEAELAIWMQDNPAESGAEAASRLAELDTSEWMHIVDPVAWVEDVQRRMWNSR